MWWLWGDGERLWTEIPTKGRSHKEYDEEGAGPAKEKKKH